MEEAPPDFLPGIDLNDGLNRMRGKWESYKRFLLLFYKEYKSSADKMASLLAAKKFEDAGLLAHSLKGVSGTLGAWQLHEQCKLMEEAVHAGDEEVVVTRLVAFRNSLEEVIDGLATLA